MGGYVIMHNNGCVDWASKSVKIVPDSTCEAETAVASFASKATCFLRMLFLSQDPRYCGDTYARRLQGVV